MAQTNYTPILLYCSGTPTNVPSATDLEFGELALNYADGKLFYKDAGGVVQQFGAGGSGTVTSVSVVSANGLAGTVANATTTPAITLSTSVTGILQGNGTAISAASTTGTGSVVLANTPTLVTPNLGTPNSGTLTNCTGLPISTGVSGLGTGVATFLATPTSANLATAVTDETGTGLLVFNNTPTLSSPLIDSTNPWISFGDGTAVTVAAGRQWYNATTGSWNLGMGGGNITQQVGEELFIYGKASAAISDSPLEIIYKTGTVGASGVINFAPTIAGITDETLIIGVATEAIANNGFGRITSFGVVHGIDTTGSTYGETWADNDDIWYNSVTGNPTNIKPVAPNIKVQIGTVINAGTAGSGSFQVLIVTGSVLGGTDSNVQLTATANGNILTYDGGNGYWKNTDLAAGTGISIGKSANGVLTVTNTSPSSGGTVTSVSFTGGIVSVATATTTPALTVAGTSGGIPYFSSGTTWASSGALAANALMIGGGAGAAPSTITTGTGVVTALGVNTGSAGAFVVNGGALGTPSSGVATNLTGTASGLSIGGNAATVTNGVYTTDTGTVTNTMLANSSLTVNGVSISLGGSGTVTAANPNALTIGSGLSGTSYDGSAAVTIANTAPMVYPGAGIPNSTGSAWGTSYTTTGSGTVLALATSPSFTTPLLGTPTSGNLANCTGYTVSNLGGLGTGVATALADNIGVAGSVVVNGGALGTPSSGTLTNCTGYPASAISGSINLTTQVTGTLPVGNGGTGVATLTGLAYGNGTSAFTAASAAQVVAVIGTTAVTNATNAANVTLAAASSATNYVVMGGSATGNVAELTDTAFTFNAVTHVITGGISGGGF